jgi:hypothetical protein
MTDSDWKDQFTKILQEREDFEFDMANFFLEEEEYNRRQLYDRKLRVVTLYQSV